MAAACAVARQIEATKRLDPPPAEEAAAWAWGIHDEEDEAGRTLTRGRSMWHRKDLCDEWHRLRFAEEHAALDCTTLREEQRTLQDL